MSFVTVPQILQDTQSPIQPPTIRQKAIVPAWHIGQDFRRTHLLPVIGASSPWGLASVGRRQPKLGQPCEV